MQAMLTLIKRIPSNPECKLMVVGTTSNYAALDLLDIDKAFKAKINVPLLGKEECKTVLGVDLGIENMPVKKLTNFKEICRDKPKAMWSSLWQKYAE